MKKVAVTGGLACGKTSVCHFFEELGACVVSADAVVHRLLLTDSSVRDAMIDLLGPEVQVDGFIDRKEVAKRIFADPETLARMEQMIHPLVHLELQKECQRAHDSGKFTLFVAEVPLLFEAGMEADFDAIIAVHSPVAATRYPGQDYRARIQRQLPIEEKVARADFDICNDGSLSDLKQKVEHIFTRLTHTG